MKTMQTGALALLLLCGIFSCKKDIRSTEDLTQTKASSTITAPIEDGTVQADCPECVKNFTATTETAATNGVLKLENGVLTPAGNTITTIPSTKEEPYTVGNVIVTVSHDAKNVYFTLERKDPTGGFGNIRFYSPAVIPIIDNGPGRYGFATTVKKVQVIRSRESLPSCTDISFSFMVKGGGNADVAGEVTTPTALTYVLRDLCPVITPCTINVGDYRTQSRGFWRNDNGQEFLTTHSNLFPVTIGNVSLSKTFETAASVRTFLDDKKVANGTPGVLPNGGTFAAQVLTLAINVKADALVADFSKANGQLANLVVNIDNADIAAHPSYASLKAFNGKTVQEILDLAQNVLGGTPSAYKPSIMNEIVTAINENFDNRTIDNGLLSCGK